MDASPSSLGPYAGRVIVTSELVDLPAPINFALRHYRMPRRHRKSLVGAKARVCYPARDETLGPFSTRGTRALSNYGTVVWVRGGDLYAFLQEKKHRAAAAWFYKQVLRPVYREIMNGTHGVRGATRYLADKLTVLDVPVAVETEYLELEMMIDESYPAPPCGTVRQFFEERELIL